jgi:hypothetical protein
MSPVIPSLATVVSYDKAQFASPAVHFTLPNTVQKMSSSKQKSTTMVSNLFAGVAFVVSGLASDVK